jgi:hypothetical protein
MSNEDCGRLFVCARCGGTFIAVHSNADAKAEMCKSFGDIPEKDRVVLCGQCHAELLLWMAENPQIRRDVRILVCGGRDFCNKDRLFSQLDELCMARGWLRLGKPDVKVIAGGARGADALAVEWARDRGCPYEEFPADWAREGRAAGILRNQRMLEVSGPEFVVAFPGGRGTADMVRRARLAGIEVIEIVE